MMGDLSFNVRKKGKLRVSVGLGGGKEKGKNDEIKSIEKRKREEKIGRSPLI